MNDWSGKISYAGSAIAASLGGITANQWVAIFGIGTAILTLVVNIWYKKKMLDYTRSHQKKVRDIYREDQKRQNDSG